MHLHHHSHPTNTDSTANMPKDYTSHNMHELDGLLKARNLARRGKKADLIARLQEDDSEGLEEDDSEETSNQTTSPAASAEDVPD